MGEIQTISTPEELQARLLASQERDVWFFKHSLTCGVSSAARKEFERFVVGHSVVGHEGGDAPQFCVVEIQPARDVSRALAERLSVRHESPQAILVRGGEAIWHASHWDITSQSLSAIGESRPEA